MTFQLPGGIGYGSITEANLVNYSGMALEADGRRSWMVGLGHRHPINYPYELRYGRQEAKRLATPATVVGPITTPWRVVLVARDLNTLVNSDILPSLCPPPDPQLFPQGIKTPWVEPGLCVWDYVDRNYVPRGDTSQLDRMKDFSRKLQTVYIFAATIGGAGRKMADGLPLRLGPPENCRQSTSSG